MYNLKRIAALLVVLLAASGCATKISDVTDENSQTMKEIYNGNFNSIGPSVDSKERGINPTTIQREIQDGPTDLRDYTRTANNEHKVLFQRIQNPILVGYVFAHLTGDDIPIPSYSIPFRMSPKDFYAMPGEARSF